MEDFDVQQARMQDLLELAEMCHCLWPDASAAEHARELRPYLAGESRPLLPRIIFVAQDPEGRLVGFIDAGLRSHADGCDPAHPVGFIEGWYVAPSYRRRKVGTKLAAAAAEWAREQGCSEMASDTWLDAVTSQRAHEALGFAVVDRCVHYRKGL